MRGAVHLLDRQGKGQWREGKGPTLVGKNGEINSWRVVRE